MPNRLEKTIQIATIPLLVMMSILAFWPGTTGGFILDDSFNLGAMQKYGGVHNLDTLRFFIFEGISGPTGRPISLLSFLIDSQSWPADPFSFKRTNILIHSLNSVLIFAVIYKLFQIIGKKESSTIIIAFLCASIWALHPLHISTVLYVIQRMTELTALFTLAGVWCYLHGRQKLQASPGPGYLWMSVAVIIFGLLAILSKENGVLLPLYILVIEFTLLRNTPRPQHWRYWAIPILVMPVITLLLYLGYSANNHLALYAVRDFNLFERLLSQPRILWDYIAKIIFPAHTPTLFFDNFQTSKSLFSPATTLLSITALIATLAASLVLRKRLPLLSFAVLWFLAGHLLESSVLPLEMYFEHRSYLPMLGIILAISFYAEKLTFRNRKPLIAGGTLVITFLAVTTWQHSHTWGNNTHLIASIAKNQPHSLRAQILQTKESFRLGDDNAMAQLEKTKQQFPESLGVATVYVDSLCQLGILTKDKFMALYKSSANLPPDSYLGASLPNLAKKVITEDCQQITAKGMIALIDKILKSDTPISNPAVKIKLFLLKSELYIKDRNLKGALRSLDQAIEMNPTLTVVLRKAELLVNANRLNAAAGQLSLAKAIDKLRSPLLPSRQKEIDRLWSKLNARKAFLS